MIIRFGGEEFAIIMPNVNGREIHAKAEVLRRKIELLKPMSVLITISIGMASTVDHPDTSLTTLLSYADKALYAAKERGRNRICIYAADGVSYSPMAENSDAETGTGQ